MDGVRLSEQWWVDLGDPHLDAVIESALTNNFTLIAAYERIAEARAIAGIERAAQSPTLDGEAGLSLSDGGDTDGQSEITLGLVAAYEIDLWDRIRSTIRVEDLEASATAADYQAAAVSLSAEIAQAVYGHAEASLQLALLESQLRTNSDVLTVIEERFAIGQSRSADVLRQRQLVEATLEQQITTRASIEVLEHQILELLGIPAQAGTSMEFPTELPQLPPLPDVGLPAALLARRPDVRAALLRLESADADVAAAVADQYPRLNLGAAASVAAENPSGLFDAWLASISAQLVAPLIDGGRRSQEVTRSVAVRRQRVAEYGDAVLMSFREVEDAIALERNQAQRIRSLEKQLGFASSTSAQLRNQYLNGAADFIDVLVSLRDEQELERSVLSARLEQIQFRISLYRAIAGGFMHTPNSEPSKVNKDANKEDAMDGGFQ